MKGGRVFGASDAKGAFPALDPCSPLDVLATIYQHLGIDTSINYRDFGGRPYPVLPGGHPIQALFS